MATEKNPRTRAKKNKNDLSQFKEFMTSGGAEQNYYSDEEDDKLFDEVTEEQYTEIVNNRRKEGDFVVDDDGLGYYDDGEEVLGVREEAYDGKKRLKEAAKEGDNKAAKKARLLAEASSLKPKNTIIHHLKSTTTLQSSRLNPKLYSAPQELLDIDAMMGTDTFKPPKNSTASDDQSRPFIRGLPPKPYQLSRPIPNFSLSYPSGIGYSTDSLFPGYGYGMDETVDQASNDKADDEDQESRINNTPHEMDPTKPADHAHIKVSPESVHVAMPKISLTKSNKKFTDTKDFSKSNVDSTFRPNLKDSYGQSNGLFRSSPDDHTNAGSPSDEFIPTFPSPGQTGTSSRNIDPKLWLKKKSVEIESTSNTQDMTMNTPVDDEYFDMYWSDASESNGLIYLYGKVLLEDPAQSMSGKEPTPQSIMQRQFVSCCLIVHGAERNLFVLPRVLPDQFKEDGRPCRESMTSVYSELTKLLVPDVVPRVQGQSFRCKTVKRNYAFEHGTVPREDTEYLKVVYSAKHGLPSVHHCQQGGKTYEKIFGASSSALELFLLKRKLMGPCWLRIKNPHINPDAVSWCRLEIAISDPKFVVRMKDPIQPPPHYVTMSLAMKSVVNPVSHVHEIVMISAVMHSKVDSEAETSMNPRLMKAFTIVRKLGLSSGNEYPSEYPHDIKTEVTKNGGGIIQLVDNERALLSSFFTRLLIDDPDVFASHNLLGFEFDVILSRAIFNKLPNWSILGKLRRNKAPKNISEKDAIPGRILCDTYKAAKEFLRETTYSLTHLAQSQLNFQRIEIDPIDVPRFFTNSVDLIKLANHTVTDASLVHRLMIKLQVVPLTKQLTTLSGNLWSRTIRGARAERIEYLLLHEFHSNKYILPEKKVYEHNGSHAGVASKKGGKVLHSISTMEEDAEENGETMRVGGVSRSRGKAAYAGGLVLEPKKGLYDNFILLLDFNSLYPSLIQEYNLCFTTIQWTKYMNDSPNTTNVIDAEKGNHKGKGKADKVALPDGENEGDSGSEVEDDENHSGNRGLPPLPDTSLKIGILPRVIKQLVDRRRSIKALLKSAKDAASRQSLDIRQKALKLTANSMYGCLGFSFSRFYARPIAALVTAMGREALQRTVDLATNALGLDVIYGDTDSVMINTNSKNLQEVKIIGNNVKKEVNKLYKSLELDLDGIFKSMLLLKKKKYAAIIIHEEADGTVTYEKELKGLDLVRRDWCPLSKDTGKFVVDQILSGQPCEKIVAAIHEYLENLAAKIRSGSMELEHFVVTKGLNKNPKDYPDCKGQAHLQVALQMLKANKPVNVGDHIPYVICIQGPEGSHAPQRAYHPDDVIRSNGALTLDFEWYLSNQILPPVSRLCEPIQHTSAAEISGLLGLDASKFAARANREDDFGTESWGFTPKCMQDDSVRFHGCKPLTCCCLSCNKEVTIASVMDVDDQRNGLTCDQCGALFFGQNNASDCFCYLSNRITLLARDSIKRYYECWLVCDEVECGRRTMQQSVRSGRTGHNINGQFQLACVGDCRGQMIQEYTEADLHSQLKYLECLFDVPRMEKKKIKSEDKKFSPDQLRVYKILHKYAENMVKSSAYIWIRPSLWSAMFGKNPLSMQKVSNGGGGFNSGMMI